MSDALFRLLDVFNGSDGDVTTRLYKELETYGPIGVVGLNLFRAQKNSARAKVYRGGNRQGSYKNQAYGRKQWAIGNLCAALLEHGAALGLVWGWGRDQANDHIPWVLYVDLPTKDGLTTQVSFHSPTRGDGPDYARAWDGITDVSTSRVLKFIAECILATPAAA